MKYLYVLISTEKDTYYEQTLFSIVTLRVHMPGAYITLLTDDITAENLINDRAKIKEKINEFVVVPLDHKLSGMRRSRWLKTSMRNLVEGDFLFIDSDTIILESLELPSDFQGEIGAVLDRHIKLTNENRDMTLLDRIEKKLCFSFSDNGLYFNSGVLYVKDTEVTRAFFKRWYELWLYTASKNIYVDQPSLGQTDFEFKYIIKELSGEWNCQIILGVNYIQNARIVHSLANNRDTVHVAMRNIFYETLKHNKNIEDLAKNTIMSFKHSFFEGAAIISPSLYNLVIFSPAFVLLRKINLRLRFLFKVINFCSRCVLFVCKYFKFFKG